MGIMKMGMDFAWGIIMLLGPRKGFACRVPDIISITAVKITLELVHDIVPIQGCFSISLGEL